MKFVSLIKPFRRNVVRVTPAASPVMPAPVAVAALTDPPPASRDDPRAAGRRARPISRWLFPQVVLLDCDARDKREVLDLAASTLERFHGVAAAPVERALWRREAAISTAIGEGVAVPHARIEGIVEPVTLLIRTAKPIAYGAPDRKPVSQLFVILVPAEGDPDDHLRLLADVAQLFSQSAFRDRIAAAADTRAVLRAFEEYAGAIAEDALEPRSGAASGISAPAQSYARRSRFPPE
jgi:PTS system nitrogen regulatory IIA component